MHLNRTIPIPTLGCVYIYPETFCGQRRINLQFVTLRLCVSCGSNMYFLITLFAECNMKYIHLLSFLLSLKQCPSSNESFTYVNWKRFNTVITELPSFITRYEICAGDWKYMDGWGNIGNTKERSWLMLLNILVSRSDLNCWQ